MLAILINSYRFAATSAPFQELEGPLTDGACH
jgi:hypothetical protein